MNTLTKTRADILNFSVSERIQLAEDIWDSVIAFPEEVTLTDDERLELDKRLESFHQSPSEGSLWAIVRERIQNRA